MATMNVSLPDKMKEWVEEKAAASGKYGNISDYVRDLIRHDQERDAKKAEFDRLVQEGIDSGISAHSMEEIRARARAGLGLKD